MHPLTHHEIIGLIAPFTRRGRRLDLPASDRLARRLVFKPMPHDGELNETLQFENPEDDNFRLTRVTTHSSGLQASLQAKGAEAGELLAGIDTVAPKRQFRHGPGHVIALSHRLVPGTSRLVLTHAEAQLDGLSLKLRVPALSGIPADIELVAAPGGTLALPEDLLAVLGWDWARLIRKPAHWSSKLRLRGGTVRRTATAEAALDTAAIHLAQTLAEPPSRFHERHVAARRGVVFRRAIPLMTPLLLVITVLALPRFDVESSPLWVLLYHVPTVCILLSFRLQELPQFEIPPWPRRSDAPSWRAVAR